MKALKYFYTSRLILYVLSAFIFSSCSDDLPGELDTSMNFSVLKSIKIVNAGANGNTVVNGVIDENTKKISFPRIDPLSNLSAIKFQAEMSDGAVLEQDVFDLGFSAGQAEKTITLKVVNKPRFKEYFATVRLRVPVFGGDFAKATVYDYSVNSAGNPIYPAFTPGTVRGTGFNGEYVLIVDRGNNSPHLLRVSDLKANKIDPIYLNNTGIGPGTLSLHSGAIAKDHIYAANLSGGHTSPLRIYHWTNPAVAPNVIEFNIGTIPGAGTRHGDNMSVNLDDNGNGYIFFADNAQSKILRLTVTNFTQMGDPTVFAAPSAAPGGSSAWGSYNRIGTSDEYIYTAHDSPVYLMNSSGTIAYSMARTSIPIRGSDARVFYFNGERYLLMLTAARGGSDPTVLYVYNISRGSTVADAISIFETETDRKAVFEYSLLGAANGNPTTQTGIYVKKDSQGNDESLLLYGSSFAAGFALVEIPKMELD